MVVLLAANISVDYQTECFQSTQRRWFSLSYSVNSKHDVIIIRQVYLFRKETEMCIDN